MYRVLYLLVLYAELIITGHASVVYTWDVTCICRRCMLCCFFFQAEDGIRDLVRSRGLGDVYKRQGLDLG